MGREAGLQPIISPRRPGCLTTVKRARATLQALVPDRLRGRVMGVYIFVFLGMAPLGSLQAGSLARWLGAPAALGAGAATLLVVILLAWLRVPEMREL